MKIVRWILGRLILIIDFITTPKSVKRDSQKQQVLDSEAKNYRLYQYKACPFCVKVRRNIKKQNLSIECIDIRENTAFKEELESKGGLVKVPCLRVKKDSGQEDWIYESDQIIQFLEQRVASV